MIGFYEYTPMDSRKIMWDKLCPASYKETKSAKLPPAAKTIFDSTVKGWTPDSGKGLVLVAGRTPVISLGTSLRNTCRTMH